jgi:hypothetical protein
VNCAEQGNTIKTARKKICTRGISHPFFAAFNGFELRRMIRNFKNTFFFCLFLVGLFFSSSKRPIFYCMGEENAKDIEMGAPGSAVSRPP